MLRLALFLSAAGLVACTGGDGGALTDASIPEDAGFADMGVEPPCTLELAADLSLSVGTIGSTPIAGEGWSEVTIESTPSGWRAAIAGGTLELRAPYVAGPADGPLRLAATCGDQTAQAELALGALPLSFEQITPWVPDDTGPLAREYFSMWIDPIEADRLWVFGGFHYVPQQFTPGHDVWSLDLSAETWTRHDEGPVRGFPGGTVAAHLDGHVLRYGGLNIGEDPNLRDTPFILHRIETSTSGLSFEDVTVEPAQVVGDYQPAFFFHPPSGKFFAVCGLNDAQGAHCDVRSFDPATGAWTEEPVDGDVPPGRNGHFWAYDPETDRLVIFSGEGFPGSASCENCLHDTWALELSASPLRWTRLAESTGMIGRRNGAFVLDPIHHRLLVWGGTNNGRTTHPGLWALDLTPGEEAWYDVPTTGGAPVRTSGAAVFDAARRRILLGFGNGDSGVHADLWAIGL